MVSVTDRGLIHHSSRLLIHTLHVVVPHSWKWGTTMWEPRPRLGGGTLTSHGGGSSSGGGGWRGGGGCSVCVPALLPPTCVATSRSSRPTQQPILRLSKHDYTYTTDTHSHTYTPSKNSIEHKSFEGKCLSLHLGPTWVQNGCKIEGEFYFWGSHFSGGGLLAHCVFISFIKDPKP